MSATATISPTATASAISFAETCTHPKPGKNGYLPPESCDVILLYVPSFGAAIFFTILFGLTSICHIVQAFTYKKVGVASRTLRILTDKLEICLGYYHGSQLGVPCIYIPDSANTTPGQRGLVYWPHSSLSSGAFVYVPDTSHLISRDTDQCRDQCLHLHDSRPPHPFLHPRSTTRWNRCQTIRTHLRLGRYPRLHRPARRCHGRDAAGRAHQHHHARYPHLHGRHRAPRTIHTDIWWPDNPSAPSNGTHGELRDIGRGKDYSRLGLLALVVLGAIWRFDIHHCM
jgi:hypothetical protein